MNTNRRTFLQKMAALLGVSITRTLGSATLGNKAFTVAGAAAAATVVTDAAVLGANGFSVRAQVFEVIVRQALAGAPWKEICSGPMAVNGITQEEIEAEVNRRKSKLNHSESCLCVDCSAKHKEGFLYCRCKDCGSKYLERSKRYMAKLQAIQHSEKSPCACSACRQAVSEILDEIRREEPLV